MTTNDDRFRAYVQASRGELMRTALFLAAGDRWGAEDLVQTALTRLYVAWARVRPDTVDACARR
jgi:DNA-directed RNA polymerase specialized sigma24 family protein